MWYEEIEIKFICTESENMRDMIYVNSDKLKYVK